MINSLFYNFQKERRMRHRIIAVKFSKDGKRIIAVKLKWPMQVWSLKEKNVLKVLDLFMEIGQGNHFFYTDKCGHEAEIEVVDLDNPNGGYIRTKANDKKEDNLLNLIRF
ncbi:conserved protein of unknown function [Oenococcus oeni]|uniref:DUF3892 domain-containing protein n=1 Tax=Oenococcus oeni TaxID=1247 RepID=UPI00107BE8C7|nr:DUF3892 domain-containing protein [Oenococcus oeni]AVI94513.1 hypothetical protein AX764_06665 [Oenococcus oeni]SYV99536.1 conserved hypothetical protein [Oenococcus oeni]SYW00676.1 conserved hypothetical protein [Oenococcus oeni]SYW02627.1 conserved hypothetical protein [Oenococcus oeni]SYW19060.1 conserved hypothetical protein [Oenococcus oeni]